MQDNKVFLNKLKIVEIQVVGDQTPDSVAAMGVAIQRLCKRRRKADGPVLVLDDILRIGVVPPEARKVVVRLGKSLDYDRLAMVGNGNVLRLGANLLLTAVGKAGKLKYFDSYDAATAWLLELAA